MRRLQAHLQPIVFSALGTSIAAVASAELNGQAEGVRVIWMGGGFALGMLIVFGWRVLPGVFLGIAAAGFWRTGSIAGALAMAVGISVEAALACWLTNRFAGGNAFLNSPARVFRFFVIAIVTAVPVAAFLSRAVTTDLSSDITMFDRWLANALGLLVVAPAVIAWGKSRLFDFPRARISEVALISATLVGLSVLVLFFLSTGTTHGVPAAFLVMPPLLWAALRFGQRGTTSTVFVLSIAIILATLTGYGPFALQDQTSGLRLMQTFVALTAFTALILASDVNQRRSVEEELRQSEQRYRELFESNPQPLMFYDSETLRILGANSAALQLYGYDHEEVLRLKITDLRDPADAQGMDRLIEPGQWKYRRKDGSSVWVEISRQDVALQGQPAVLILCEDISDRKLAEQRFSAQRKLGRDLSIATSAREAARAIAEAADTMLGWDSCRVDLYSEDEFELVFCADIINGKRTDLSSKPGTTNQCGPLALKALKEGPQLELRRPGAGFPEGAVPFGDKTRPALSLMVVPIRSGDRVVALVNVQSYRENAYTHEHLQILQSIADQCGGALERIRAVRALVNLNQDLEQHVARRTAQLQATNKELEAFSYSVSHDLRAPLRSVRGFTEVLTERYGETLDKTGQDFLRRTCDAARTMERLIDDLLKLSRLGRAQMQFKTVDISQLANEVASELAAEDKGRSVEWRIAPGLRVCGDDALLRVLLDNLLRNAWKFTGRQEKAVIEVGRTEGEEPAFFVRDNGAGFDMQYAGKLFGVFQRLHAASEFPGTGVGLATAQRIVTRHAGRIWAEAAVNKGATFYFTLPPDECN